MFQTPPCGGTSRERAANASWSLNAYEGPLSGHYHALRVYNRKLNAEELLQNAIVDKVRYWNTYPTGYRDSGGVLQKRVLVAKPTGCVLEVDGVAQAGDFEDWSAFGTRATCTLTATPESGYQFQRWAGDMDCVTSGNLYSNTITVARSLAMSFTPVFTAIPEPVLASPVYTITVASGTRELTTAVDDDNNAIGTTGTIVKKGAGTLQIKSDVISTFAGEIVIEAGRWYSGTRSGLGTKNGGAVNATNSTVELSAAMEYHLPDLVLSGTGSVFSVAGTTGSFKNATKAGGDTITWNTKVGAKSFALNGGTLKFGTVPVANGAAGARRRCPGGALARAGVK